jgi:hypothetical protein
VTGGFFIVVSGFLQGFAYSTAELIGGRIVVSCGDVFAIVGATSLVNEVVHPELGPTSPVTKR